MDETFISVFSGPEFKIGLSHPGIREIAVYCPVSAGIFHENWFWSRPLPSASGISCFPWSLDLAAHLLPFFQAGCSIVLPALNPWTPETLRKGRVPPMCFFWPRQFPGSTRDSGFAGASHQN